MFYVLQNESVAARRRVPILLTDAATGTTAQSGVALTTIFAHVNSNGGAFTLGAGTIANSGFGQYYYQFDPSEIATLGLAGIHVTALNCRDYDSIVQVAAFDMYSASSGATAYAIAQEVWNTDLVSFPSDTAGQNLYFTYQEVDNNLDASVSGVPAAVWNSDMPSYVGVTNSAGEYLYNLGTGATGYPSGGSGLSAYDVWNFVLSDSNTAEADLVSAASGSGLTAGDVWDFNILGFGGTNSAAEYLTGAYTDSANTYTQLINNTAADIWTYTGIPGRTITGGAVSSVSDPVTFSSSQYSAIASSVWNAGSRTITGGLANTVTSVTNPVLVDPLSMTGIAGTVWNSPVASYSSNGTFGLNILRADAANKVGDVTLRSAGGINMVDADIHRIDNDADAATNLKNILTGVGSTITGNIVGNVSGNVTGSVGSVTADVNVSTGSMTGIAGTVWSYATRTLTSGGSGISAYDVWNYVLSDSNTAENDLVNIASDTQTIQSDISGIPNLVWSQDISGYVTPGEAGYELSQASSGAGLTAGDVWDYSTRTLTSGGSGISAADVWSYNSRTITGGIADTVSNVTGNVSGSVGSVLGNVSGNVVGSVGSVTGNVSGNVIGSVGSVTGNVAGTVAAVTGNVSGNVVGSVGSVTGNVSGNVIGSVGSVTGNVSGNVVGSVGSVTGNVAGTVAAVTGNVSGNVVGSVASVTNPVTFNSSQYASIASSVWNAATRTLTSGGSGISAYEVWNYVLSDSNTAEVDLVSAASGAGLTAGDVWSYASREITGGIANTVTSLTNGVTVTTNNDKTGYALSTAGVNAVQSGLSTLTQAQVGTEVDSSLSDVGLTSTVTGRIDVAVSSRLASSSYETPPTAASIASSVWSAGSRTITGGTVATVTNDVNVSTGSMTGIAGTVWNYASRTITGGGGATSGDVWNYPTRSLTSGAGITVNAATNIINGPYFVKSNVDGQDGNLDVITGMVQDIQLTVTDAFGNPFDTTALGLAVNFYNQAGTLTTSYSTSELYGPAGLVQFTLDTAVTGTEGRYNLILSAAGAGNTIKFGPLTTLVRPY